MKQNHLSYMGNTNHPSSYSSVFLTVFETTGACPAAFSFPLISQMWAPPFSMRIFPKADHITKPQGTTEIYQEPLEELRFTLRAPFPQGMGPHTSE